MASVFVVDDDDGYRELIRALLEEKGHVVTDAVNGADALRKLEKMPQAPDLFVMDLRMPELGGYELTMRLRQLERTREVPIVMLTGSGQGVRDLAEREGVVFLQKLVASNNEIVDHVERLLQRRNPTRAKIDSDKPLEIDRFGAPEAKKGKETDDETPAPAAIEAPKKSREVPVPNGIENPKSKESPAKAARDADQESKEGPADGSMDEAKFDEIVLAMLWYNERASMNAWKGFDAESLERLFKAKLISNPKSIRKSVDLSEAGEKRGKAAFLRFFGNPRERET